MTKYGKDEEEVRQRNVSKWQDEVEGLPCGAAKLCIVDITAVRVVKTVAVSVT
jgi:hypothetical protein